jgi:2,3-dihydroxybenzoate decarboxylase
MRRRDLLRGAALAGASVVLPAAASIGELETIAQNPLGKIAMEEHFMVPEFMEYFADTYPNINADIAKLAPGALMDFGEQRLAVMDEHHVEYVVLSLAGPGVQAEKDGAAAQRKARAVNDFLVGEIQKRPARYGGFAHLAMHNPSEAAEELERCIRDLGFHGALINGQTNGEYLDLDKYSVFWERAAALEAPIYLHPGNPIDHPATYAGHNELWGPVCSWAFETATHALRLVFAGVFERYPKVRLILGHGGETLPYSLWRFDSRWQVCNRGGRTLAKPPSFYIRRNIAVTTSGMCSDDSLRCSLDAMGVENVMFSIDYPFEKTEIATRFIETANATRILHLDHHRSASHQGV